MNNQNNQSETATWFPIKGYEGLYEINREGMVKSLARKTSSERISRTVKERYLKPRLNNFGYAEVRLSKNGVPKTRFVHVLMAEIFIANNDNKPEVNHKNGIKDDNRLENLEWVTHSENMKHAYQIGLLKPKGKKVIDLLTGQEYETIKSAASANGYNYYTLKNFLNGHSKTNPTSFVYKNAA